MNALLALVLVHQLSPAREGVGAPLDDGEPRSPNLVHATTSTRGLDPATRSALEDALFFEGELEACEVRERGLEARLRVRRAPAPAIPIAPVVTPEAEFDVGLLVGVAGASVAVGVVLGLLAAGALQ